MAHKAWDKLLNLAGWRSDTTSHREKLISAVGATLALLVVYWVTHLGLVGEGALWVTGSMGASAVLVFAMPHGVLSQPWPVIGGHTLSAAFGVACLQWMPAGAWLAAFAVGGSIVIMMYARCLHPPGGATAMIAVLGGPEIEAAGFGFVLYPILLDALVIIFAAVFFNALFESRRYPLGLASYQPASSTGIAPENLQHALGQVETFQDVRFEELLHLVELAHQHAQTQGVRAEQLETNGLYSNGLPGRAWSVREIIALHHYRPGRAAGAVKYRVVKGVDAGREGSCALPEFLRWARFRVEQHQGTWRSIDSPHSS